MDGQRSKMLDLATQLTSSTATIEIFQMMITGKDVPGEDILTVSERLGGETADLIREMRTKSGDPIPPSIKKGPDTILDCAYLLATSKPIIEGKDNGASVVADILHLRRDAYLKAGGAVRIST